MPTAPKTLRIPRTKAPERRPSSNERYPWEWQKGRRDRIKRLVLRDGLLCGICRNPLPTDDDSKIHVDHKIPPSSRGPIGSEEHTQLFWDETNMQLAHAQCNSRKQNRQHG